MRVCHAQSTTNNQPEVVHGSLLTRGCKCATAASSALPYKSVNATRTMSGKKDKASAEDLHVMDTVEQYESYEDYLDSQVTCAG